jgi:hypothetical protein
MLYVNLFTAGEFSKRYFNGFNYNNCILLLIVCIICVTFLFNGLSRTFSKVSNNAFESIRINNYPHTILLAYCL